MLFAGLQKLTLLDFPGRVACTLFTAGCNLRCPFCHNAALVLPEQFPAPIAEDDLLAFLKKRAGVLDGVALTGGEPLLHRDLPEFLEKVKALGYRVKLDTNGALPDRLRAVVEAGLVDRVAMDIKNAPEHYAETCGLQALDLGPFERSKEYLLSGPVEYEFRTTVVKGLHTEERLIGAAKWIRGAREYYLQQFKDSGNLLGPGSFSGFSEEEMHRFAAVTAEYVPSVQVRGVQ